jgi:hypothetical protein
MWCGVVCVDVFQCSRQGCWQLLYMGQHSNAGQITMKNMLLTIQCIGTPANRHLLLCWKSSRLRGLFAAYRVSSAAIRRDRRLRSILNGVLNVIVAFIRRKVNACGPSRSRVGTPRKFSAVLCLR